MRRNNLPPLPQPWAPAGYFRPTLPGIAPTPKKRALGLAWGGVRAIDTGYVTGYVIPIQALTNAEKQKRWREKRNRLARQASSVAGLIELLARSVRNKRDREIEDVIVRVEERLRRVIQERKG